MGSVITDEDRADTAIAEAILNGTEVSRDAVMVKVKAMNHAVRESAAGANPEVVKQLDQIDGLMKFVGLPTPARRT